MDRYVVRKVDFFVNCRLFRRLVSLMLEDIGSNVFDRILTFTRRRRKVITIQFFQVQIWFSFLFLFLFLFHFFLLFTVVKLFFNFINRVRNLRWFNPVRKEIAGYWLLPQFKIACAHLRSKLLAIFIFDRVVTLMMDFNYGVWSDPFWSCLVSLSLCSFVVVVEHFVTNRQFGATMSAVIIFCLLKLRSCYFI